MGLPQTPWKPTITFFGGPPNILGFDSIAVAAQAQSCNFSIGEKTGIELRPHNAHARNVAGLVT